MSITDLLTIILATFLLFSGFNRGFISSLLGPISLILATLIAYIYYNTTQNIPISLCIGLFGPFILGLVFRICLQSWFALSGAQGAPNLASRIAGALVTLSWGMVLLIISVLLLAMIPPINKPLEYLYQDIHNAKLYQIIKPLDSYAVDKPEEHIDLKTLSEDKRIQDIVHDPSIVDAINRKDYSALISNPKITAIMQDPPLMKKMLSAYRQMMQEQNAPQSSNVR